MAAKIELVALLIALGAAPAIGAPLKADDRAGRWYDVTHEDRDAWIAFAVRVGESPVAKDALGPKLRDCIRETAEPYEKMSLGEVTALCLTTVKP